VGNHLPLVVLFIIALQERFIGGFHYTRCSHAFFS
jgi:hypothetical protein